MQTFEAIQRHLELVSKTLSRISFGTPISTSVPVGNAEPDRNIQCWKATGTTPGVANTEFAVAHNLPYVPVGFLIASTTPAGHIYKSTTAWTAATNAVQGNIYLKSDTASVAYVLILI